MNEKGIDTKLLESKMFLKGYKTRKSFADAVGVSEHTIGTILNGKGRPSHELINNIYHELDLTPVEGTAIFFSGNLRDTKVKEVN